MWNRVMDTIIAAWAWLGIFHRRRVDSLKRFWNHAIIKANVGWNWLAEYHRHHFIANLTSEDHQLNFRTHFDKAKTLSDFIGMILRYSFATFAWSYFLKRVPEATGFHKGAFGVCFVFSLGITIALGARIFAIILFYETKDLHKQTHNAVKVAMLIAATVTTYALYIGINDVVAALAKAGGISK
jgi:hypothetical protein